MLFVFSLACSLLAVIMTLTGIIHTFGWGGLVWWVVLDFPLVYATHKIADYQPSTVKLPPN